MAYTLPPETTLTAYQTAFVEEFLTAYGPGHSCLLVAPVGSGKSFAIACVVAELLRSGRAARILHIAAGRAVAEQWRYIFGRFGVSRVLADSNGIRRLQVEFADDPTRWPAGVCVVTAAPSGGYDSLPTVGRVPWDLVVIDDSLSAEGVIETLQAVAVLENAPALLVAAAQAGPLEVLASAPAQFVDWTHAVAALRQAESAQDAANAVTERVEVYTRTEAEVQMIRNLVGAARGLSRANGERLLLAATSSSAAIEDFVVSLLDGDDDSGGREAARALLGQLDELSIDSRLRAMIGALEAESATHTVIFTESRPTAEYLTSGARTPERRTFLVHEAVSADEVHHRMSTHREAGGVLVIVARAAEGISLSYAGTVVHYDLPPSARAWLVREGRYQRRGRSGPCNVVFLRDAAEALPLEHLMLRLVDAARLPAGGDTRLDLAPFLAAVP